MGEGRIRALWAPQTRALSAGLVLTITFVASEALAVVTVLPLVVRDLGGLRLYGWVFSAFMLSSMVGIVLAGREADRRGPAPGRSWSGWCCSGAGWRSPGWPRRCWVLVAGRVLQGLGAGAGSRRWPTPRSAAACMARSGPG